MAGYTKRMLLWTSKSTHTPFHNQELELDQSVLLVLLPGKLLQKPFSIFLAGADSLLPRPLLVVLALGKLLKVHHAFDIVLDEFAMLVEKVACFLFMKGSAFKTPPNSGSSALLTENRMLHVCRVWG